MLSTLQTAKILGITRVTLMEWVKKKKIRFIQLKIGTKIYTSFDMEEVRRIKKLMIKNPKPGKSILREER